MSYRFRCVQETVSGIEIDTIGLNWLNRCARNEGSTGSIPAAWQMFVEETDFCHAPSVDREMVRKRIRGFDGRYVILMFG